MSDKDKIIVGHVHRLAVGSVYLTMATTFLGKCKCGGKARISCVSGKVVERKDWHGVVVERVYTWTLPSGATSRGDASRFFAACLCGRSVELKRLVGRIGKQKCGARCMSSTGHVCECTCGGANHGKSYEA